MTKSSSQAGHRVRNISHYVGHMFGLVIALFGVTVEFSFSADWRPVNSGLSSLDVRALAINPVDPATIYAAGGAGVFKSTDAGASWRNTGLPGNITVALAIDSANPNTLYAAIAQPHRCFHSDRRIFKSIDGGVSWSNSISPPINGCDNIHSLVIDPTEPGTLYVANFDDFIGDTWTPLIKTTDGGATWRPLFGTPFDVLAIDPLNSNTLYAGTFDFEYYGYEGVDHRNGVLKSTDGGVKWASTGLANTAVNVLAIDPLRPSILYAATRGVYKEPKGFRGLFKSTDSGTSWFAINNGLTDLIETRTAVAALVVDLDNPNILYAGTAGRGVFKSIDGGATWSPFSDGFTSLDIRDLAIVSGNPNTLYAGTSGGVFKIVDDTPVLSLDVTQYCIGTSWKLIGGNGAPNTSVRLIGTTNGQPWEIAEWRNTGANGGFSVGGTFPEGTEGSYTLRIEIGGVFSNTISFEVSRCKL